MIASYLLEGPEPALVDCGPSTCLDALEANAGTVTIELTNDSSVAHDVAVEGNGVDEKSDIITQSTTTLAVDLEPGTYTFYCSVDGHRAAGMEGTLTVK